MGPSKVLPHVQNRLTLEATVWDRTRHRKRRSRHGIRNGCDHTQRFRNPRARQLIVDMGADRRRPSIGITLYRWRSGALYKLGWRTRCPGLLGREFAPEAGLNWIRNKGKHPRIAFVKSRNATCLRKGELLGVGRGRTSGLLDRYEGMGRAR